MKKHLFYVSYDSIGSVVTIQHMV